MTEGCNRYPECGVDSCIVLVTGPDCCWCDVMKQRLCENLKVIGASFHIVQVVDVEVEPLYGARIRQLPFLRVCTREYTGLIQDTDILSAILNVYTKPCFQEGVS